MKWPKLGNLRIQLLSSSRIFFSRTHIAYKATLSPLTEVFKPWSTILPPENSNRTSIDSRVRFVGERYPIIVPILDQSFNRSGVFRVFCIFAIPSSLFLLIFVSDEIIIIIIEKREKFYVFDSSLYCVETKEKGKNGTKGDTNIIWTNYSIVQIFCILAIPSLFFLVIFIR